MSAIILKSKNSLNPNVESLEYSTFEQRVLNDGGTIVDAVKAKDALRFLVQNNISGNQALSVTSPQWAIKTENGLIKKIYSLLNPLGDIDVKVSDTAKARIESKNNINALYLKLDTFDLVETKNLGSVKGLSACVVHSPISYGYAGGVLSAEGDGVGNGKIALVQRWNSSDKLPPASTWTPVASANKGRSLPALSPIPYTNWCCDTYSQADDIAKRYNNGVENGSVATTGAYGGSIDNVNARFGYYSGAGVEMHIAESWILNNVSHEVMRAVSLRASSMYA